MLSVDPAVSSVGVGDMPAVNINISDLGNFAAPSVSAFDIDVAFDPTVLSFSSVSFGTALDLFNFGTNITGVTPGALSVNVFEISFDFPGDLDTLQPGAFTLFTVNFNAIAPGNSSIVLSVNDLGDSIGNPIADPGLSTGSIEVGVAAVPEPGTISLLMAGLAIAAVRFRRHRIQ